MYQRIVLIKFSSPFGPVQTLGSVNLLTSDGFDWFVAPHIHLQINNAASNRIIKRATR